MADLTAQRTLVKSPPELWSELSEVESLARHLGELGEIRITKVEPETTVAWEGEQISGTVELEQSGWGTKVTFHATVPEPDPVVEVEPEPPAEPDPPPVAAEAEAVTVQPPAGTEAEPVVTEPIAVADETEQTPEPTAAEPVADKRPGFFARWLFRQRRPAESESAPGDAEPLRLEPEPVTVEMEAIAVEPEPVPVEPEPTSVALEAVESETIEPALDADRVQQVLDGTLDALGQAHHRPFSRG